LDVRLTLVKGRHLFIQNLAERDFEGRQMKDSTRSSLQILSVCVCLDLVRLPRQDGWTDLAEILWQCSGRVAIGFAQKIRKK
jgi:hypothetical protein